VNNVHHASEIGQHKVLERGDNTDQKVLLFDFPRNLNTKDIPGAIPGSLQSKGVRNYDLSFKIRGGDNPLYHNGPENFGLQDRLNKYRVHRHVETPPNLRSQSHGRPSHRNVSQGGGQTGPNQRYLVEQYSDIFNRKEQIDNGRKEFFRARAAAFPVKMTPTYDGLRNITGPQDNYTAGLRNYHYNAADAAQTARLSRSAAGFKNARYYDLQERNNERLATTFERNERPVRTPIKNYHLQTLQAQQQAEFQPQPQFQPLSQPQYQPQPQPQYQPQSQVQFQEQSPQQLRQSSRQPSPRIFAQQQQQQHTHEDAPGSRLRSEPMFDKDFREFYKDLTKVQNLVDQQQQQHKPKTPIPQETHVPERHVTQENHHEDRGVSRQQQQQILHTMPSERQERAGVRSRPESKTYGTDPARSFRIGEAQRTDNSPLKKLFVFDILANKPSIKLVPAKTRVPSGYGFIMKPEMNGWMPGERVAEGGVSYRRNFSNPPEMSARERSRDDFSRNNFRNMQTEGY